MAAEDSQNSGPRSGPPDIAALVSQLAASVSDLSARLDRIERTVSLQSGPVKALSFAEPVEAAAAPAGSAPPPPLLRPVDSPTSAALPRQTSFEDRLGSQIFNRIAIVAILIGAALGLKLAIDNHLIGPLGRILVGLAIGAGLVVWSERFRRREFAAFSYSLKAIGSGILYLSLWAAFQLYHLLPAQAAFA